MKYILWKARETGDQRWAGPFYSPDMAETRLELINARFADGPGLILDDQEPFPAVVVEEDPVVQEMLRQLVSMVAGALDAGSREGKTRKVREQGLDLLRRGRILGRQEQMRELDRDLALEAIREHARVSEKLTRSQWAESRHVIRLAYQDLNGLHTYLEKGDWDAAHLLAEIARIQGTLDALRTYLRPGAHKGGIHD
jgi:hypothetical protein